MKDKEVPTPPSNIVGDDEVELRRNWIPLELFNEICLYYMDDYQLDKIDDLQYKNKEIFRFVIVNMAHHG